MWPDRRLIELFEIAHPLILAPMAGLGTVGLAAEVCEAGGLGSIGCATMQPQLVAKTIQELRGLTSKPINVNFFCHGQAKVDPDGEHAWQDRLLPSSTEIVGIFDGFGCFPEKMPAAKNTGDYIPDDFEHEIGTTFLVKDRGLVVLTSCSHRGVINTVRQAIAASGIDKVHAVIGGFHIVPPLGDDYIGKTIEEFRRINPDYLITGHCTGDRFYDLARQALGDKVIHSAVGMRFVFEKP